MQENERLNVNLILCESYDKDSKSVNRIFNELITSKEHRSSFSILTFISGIGMVNTSFVLHYYLMEQESDDRNRRKGLYIGAVSFVKNESQDKMGNIGSTFANLDLESVPFLNETKYCVEAYMVEGNDIEGESYEELRERSKQYRENGTLVSAISFDVKFPDSQ